MTPDGIGRRVSEGEHKGMVLFLVRYNRQQFCFEPGMQHRIRSMLDSFGSHFSRGRAKQGQQFRRSISELFMRLLFWFARLMPVTSRRRNRLRGSGLILTPQRDACLFCGLVGPLNHAFFPSVFGSCTRTTPSLRLRSTVPVWHQVRLCP